VGKKVADVTAGQDGMTVLIPVINLLWRLVSHRQHLLASHSQLNFVFDQRVESRDRAMM
jgi:hypothetical protein